MNPSGDTLIDGNGVSSTPGGKGQRGTIGPLIASVPRSVRRISATIGAPGTSRGAGTDPQETVAGKPSWPRLAAIRPTSPKTWTSVSRTDVLFQAGACANRSGARQKPITCRTPSSDTRRPAHASGA